ncbi:MULTISPECIES: Mbeg1-like protein [unclassified Lysobacter]|uniref:Mbeg1-like protein n=1 Tax=unclassified Lysobacter TaxID=2635362 RepID=UPI001BE60970|nr:MULTISPECIES: Mbeg1-like protein [unclassified Lysobacter]MBT2747225.1 DUF2974 domain-containing protein [Lysobacter sp. ISL-42]MBT2750271.1 DUF2974 domain-containing protein [Lysobacter sp. ISL-50]MBT2777763.1 DUF2974 domain-containing protein [Lysobacter sp. ISL-54]MBT2783699.1 DUF2974 domain-containing protein [Lysobacter sp. ISL-52]
MSWTDITNPLRFAIDQYLHQQPLPVAPPLPAPLPPPPVETKVELPYSPHVPVPQAQQTPFSDQLRGQQPQKEIDTALAELSSDVYEPSRTGAAGWTKLTPDQLINLKGADGKPAGIDPASLDTTGSGFRAAVYTNGDGQYVVAFAGTNDAGGDLIADGGQGFGINTPQYNQAVTLAKEAEAAFGDNVVFTGHSLGGGLASTAALATGNTAVTFNAAGLSNDTLRDLGFTPHDARSQAEDGQIRRYNVDGDPLTGAQQGVELINGMPDAVGYELNLAHPGGWANPLTAHGCATVIEAMKTQTPTPTPSIEGDELGLLDRAAEDVSETALDLVGDAGNEFGELMVNGYRHGTNFVGDVKNVANHEYADGRYFDGTFKLAGDLTEGVLNFAGDSAHGAFNLAGDTLQGAGELTGGLIRDVGEYAGLEGAGDTVAGWVEDGGEWLGHRAEDLGGLTETVIDGVGTAAEVTFDFAGDVVEGGVNVVKDVGGFLNPFD